MQGVVQTGTIVGGRYKAVRVAWPTAAGPVWHAKDTVLDRDVLLFTLAPDVAENDRAREALMAAASRSATLIDANVAQVYDCSVDPPYLVSEMPPGGRLAERIADRPMPLAEAARVVTGVAQALRVLHEHGVAHAAIGPASIALDEEGRAKLLGTGLADVAAIAAALRDGGLDPPLQPPGYPEAGADPLAGDVRSLAAVAFHMLTGKPPGTPGATLVKAKVPQSIAAVIDRGLRGDADVATLSSAFAPHAAPATTTEREPGFLRTEGRWLAGVLLAIGIAVALAIVGLGVVRSTTSKHSNPAPSAAPSISAFKIVSSVDFDPLGDGKEHTQQAPFASDGDFTTTWFTSDYASVNVGGKAGVGLLFDLGSAQRVARIRVRSPDAGWQADWKAADQAGKQPSDYGSAGTFTAQSPETTIAFTQARTARYWLLWITRLTDTGAGSLPFRAAVSEVQFLPA